MAHGKLTGWRQEDSAGTSHRREGRIDLVVFASLYSRGLVAGPAGAQELGQVFESGE